ncbi:hypothetical protein SLEP1_g1088 [Rubroshorea leprosula]|uniref:Uncharacterized protein n=1 Tax=Rubroshorea leprosula TaxID=152421 RepID=A0AAV5HHC5_9ROSI|nr:hypothetical protein SLEP1_g1088 [Rubroshorea leprosula]
MGDGVLGSNSGGVKPTGASFAGAASVFPSAAAALMVLEKEKDLVVKEIEEDGFHGARGRLLDFGVVIAGVKRAAAWAAMAVKDR